MSAAPPRYHLVRKARELTPEGGTILDFGTAWHHHDAFLLYLMGDYKIYLFDVQDRAWLSYIKTYLEYLTENLDVVALRAVHRPRSCQTKAEQSDQNSSHVRIYINL